jgi:hypothetical protein
MNHNAVLQHGLPPSSETAKLKYNCIGKQIFDTVNILMCSTIVKAEVITFLPSTDVPITKSTLENFTHYPRLFSEAIFTWQIMHIFF